MKIRVKKCISGLLLLLLVSQSGIAQDKSWTLDDCINYALSKNITIQKSNLSKQSYELNYKQSKYNRLPSVDASVSQSFSWGKTYNSTTEDYGDFSGQSITSYGVNSSVTLFNGFKQKNEIEQARINMQSSEFYSESVIESVELNILDAYLQILYAQEEVNNSEQQIDVTSKELELSKERMDVGIVSKSDYLQIKSELASEKLTLAEAKSDLDIAKLNLMQLIELPVTSEFQVVSPDIESLIPRHEITNASAIYTEALNIKPEIKEARLTVESTRLNEEIARADLLPSLTMSAGISTGWSNSTEGYNYTEQLSNELVPSVGFTLSVPIFQKYQVRTDIKLAQISTNDAELDQTETKNTLRKEIEQACVDFMTAQSRYEAAKEEFEATKELYAVSEEKYELGLVNSVDFVIVKNDMITSRSSFLQAKYNLLFSKKIVDFYKGISISLTK